MKVRKSKKEKIIIIILALVIISLGAFIVYDKFIKKEDTVPLVSNCDVEKTQVIENDTITDEINTEENCPVCENCEKEEVKCPTCRYKVLGKLIRTKTDTLFVFDLTGAEKYKRKDAETGRLDRKAYYPVDWMDRFGVPVNEHQDLTLVSIFDDYTVFRIDKEEEREGKIQNDTDNITGHEEEKDKDTPDDTKAYE